MMNKRIFSYIIIILFLSLILFGCNNDTLNPNSNCLPPISNLTIESHSMTPNAKVRDFQILNSGNGYIVGMNGLIVKYTENDHIFSVLSGLNSTQSISYLHLNTVHFTDDSIGFIAGERKICCSGIEIGLGSIFLSTKNGGISWQKHYHESILKFTDLYFTSDNIGLALCRTNNNIDSTVNSSLLLTTNGGIEWNNYPLDNFVPTSTSFNIYESNIYIIGKMLDAGFLIKISGNNLDKINFLPLPENNCYKYNPINQYEGILLCSNFPTINQMYTTTDGGQNWKTEDKYPINRNSILHFESLSNGIIINSLYEYYESGGEIYNNLREFEIYEIKPNEELSSYKVEPSKYCDFSGIHYSTDNSLYILNNSLIKIDQ